MPFLSKAGLATRPILTYCISSHCSKAFSMSPTCAHCLRYGSACRRRNRAAFSAAALCISHPNVRCIIDVGGADQLAISVQRGDTQDVISSQTIPSLVVTNILFPMHFSYTTVDLELSVGWMCFGVPNCVGLSLAHVPRGSPSDSVKHPYY